MKKMHKDRGPAPSEVLFRCLLEEDTTDVFERVSEGLSACGNNAERLLSDAQCLMQEGRLASARFLNTTAREEISKSYILVDACRLDTKRHHSVLKSLCQAFYDHIAKHAYLEVQKSPNFRSMADLKAIWEIEVTRWWPAGYESGEPDMPHDTYFDRQFPLYTDYNDYDHCWIVPEDSEHRAYFTEFLGEDPLSKTINLHKSWQDAEKVGLCSAQTLSIINSVFSKVYVNENTSNEKLIKLYETAAKQIKTATGIATELFMASPLAEMPLYHFASECK